MNLDIAPFADQIEMVFILDITAQHTVFDLRIRLMHRVVIAIIEFVKQANKVIAGAGLYPEVIDVKVIPQLCERFQCHDRASQIQFQGKRYSAGQC